MKQYLFTKKRTLLIAKKKKRLCLKLILFCILLIGNIDKSNAILEKYLIDWEKYTITNHEGKYIDFKIPFYDSDGRDDHVDDGNIYVKIEGEKDKRLLFQYWTNDQDKAPYWHYIRCLLGTGKLLGTQDGDKIVKGAGDWTQYTEPSDGRFTYFTIRWYIPAELEGKTLSFSANVSVDRNATDVEDYSGEHSWGTTYVVKSYLEPDLDFTLSNTPGMYSVTYIAKDQPSKIVWGKENESSTTKQSDSHDIPVADSVQTYTVKIGYPFNDYTTIYKSKDIVLPAFHKALNFNAEDTINGDTKLTWTIADTGLDNCQEGDEFKIQRATDNQFSAPVTLNTVKFDTNNRSYSVIDPTGKDNLNGIVYYRISRTKQQAWGWNWVSEGQIDKSMTHQKLIELKAEDITSSFDEGIKVKVSWKVDSISKHVVKTDGAKIVIRQVNATQNNTTTYTYELPLDDKSIQTDVDGYSYIIDNKLYQTCMEYKYFAYIKPGSSKYSAETEKEATYVTPIKPVLFGKVDTLVVSKGYFSDRVDLRWVTDGNPISRFAVQRRLYNAAETDAEKGFSTITEGVVQAVEGQTDYMAKDDTPNPGEIYEYRILAQTDCAGEVKSASSKIVRGFRSPTGSVSGRITYEFGDAVSDVTLYLSSEETLSGQSLKFKGSNNSYAETFDEIDIPETFSIQAYVKPSAESQTQPLVSAGRYILGLQDGKPAISANGGSNYVTAETVLGTKSFYQLTMTFGSDNSLNLYVDGELVKSQNANGIVGETTAAKAIIGKNFNGYIDEVRLWGRALPAAEVKSTYDRLLAGNESDLIAYWRFNDPVTDEYYDISYSRADYNAHHGLLKNVQLATRTEEYPTPGQLALKGVTNKDGIYTITGIPYTGSGTTYTLTPKAQDFASFTPESRTITIGESESAQSDINFTNTSSVKIEGYVFYENSSIPVKDATFTINDQTVIANGEPVRSGTDGHYSFSVPIGKQTVRVVKANHTFKNNGRIVDTNGEDWNYKEPMASVYFWDQTKVKLIGRVAGGTVEQNKPLGFSLSKNNLGDDAVVTLKLSSGDNSEIYDKDFVYGADGQPAENAPDQMDSTQIHWDNKHKNKVFYYKNSITIHPDKETGEYEAWLYPTEYKVTNVTIQGWDDLLEGGIAQTLDLSNAFVEQTSEYTPVDEKGNELATISLPYNAEWNKIHRVQPTISYKQGNQHGATTEYFGSELILLPNMLSTTEQADTLLLYEKSTKEYLFKGKVDGKEQGLPIFEVGKWGFHVEATEDYYYNGEKNSEDVIVDRVPTQGGDLSVTNDFSFAEPREFELNDQGKAYIELSMDKPVFASNAFGRITFKVTIDGKAYEAPQLVGYLIGQDPQTDGLDFVTAGPIKLLNILRDPPGSASYTWWESGQTYSYNTTTARGMTNVGGETTTAMLGVKTAVGIGIGAMTLNESEIENNVSAVVNHEETSNNPKARTVTITTNNRYQTSDDPLNVGSAADVFIGYSNNIYYGAVNEIEILDEKSYISKGGEKEIYLTAKKDGITYYICKGSNLSVSLAGTTLFSYPKMHIENILIPNIEKLRNDLIWLPDSISKVELQAKANQENRVFYYSNVKKDDEQFGQPKSYEMIIPNAGLPEEEMEDDYLSKFFGKPRKVKNGTPDSISIYNSAIKEWIRVLKQNEDEKLTAIKDGDYIDRNRSFHASAPVEYSESFEMAKEEGYEYEFVVTAGVATEFGFAFNKAGTQISISEEGGQVGVDEQNSSSTENSSTGFVLADEGDFDYLSVDVLRVAPVDTTFKNKWDNMRDSLDNWGDHIGVKPEKMTQYGNYVFRTRAGATACPYEPAEYTQYQDGEQKLLNEATMQIERPDITVEKPVVTNVPSDKAAVFNLKLMNDSQVSGATAIFTLAIVDAANQKGAKFSIDGVPLADGRGIEVPYGEVLNKVLEVRRGTEYDYENLALVLKSQCQSDPTDNQADIADTVYISAHFIPSSSDINIKSPTDKWTLNTNAAKDSASGKYYLPLTIDGFDVNFQGFHHIEVQYKASSEADTRWTNICSFFTDTAYYKEASGTKAFIEGPTITTRFFGAEDQNYDIRAVTFSKVGNEFVTKESPVITGVKDTKRPVVFGNIEPADGVLGVEDEIRLTFNETIAEGYMTEVKNFRVTGTRNGSNGDHSTALTFDGRNSYLETQVTRNLEAKDVTVEMWINPSASGQDMTLFSHGDATNALELTLAKDNTLKVRIGELEYSSRGLNVKLDEWQHIAMTYQAANQQLSVYFSGQEVVTGVQTVPYSGIGPMRFGRSLKGGNYFAGQMHEARVWTKVVEMTDLIANSLRIYTGREAGLLAYYRMNEGKGDMAMDKSQGATAYMYGATWSTQDGKSLSFNGKDAIAVVNSSRVAITGSSDYTLEFWFKAAADQKEDAALVANGKGVGEESNGNTNKVFVGFVDNELLFRNNGYEQKVAGNFRDGAWHHFVLAVNRTAGNAQIFMDGVLNSYFDASNVGGFSATQLYAGARRWTEAEQMVNHTDMHLDGAIDELRIWNMALPASTVSNNYNISPEGTEMGLMMYLPFSKYITNSANIQELVYSGDDLVTDSTLVTLEKAVATSEVPPVCKKAPETSIPFTFVVNKDALVINLMDTPEAIEKTTVNFTVKDVSDLNGNLMESPVTWSAYIDRNQLKWSEKSVTKEKKLNATMTFAVDVENHGGTVKNFTIEGLPAWLDAMPESGSIDPQGRETILFTVDEGTNVGRYDEVIYVKGDNNVAESLPVTLKVFDEQPDWTVNPGDFAYNMNVYGRIRFNKLFSADAEDMLAAFDAGGRCIGVANSQYLKDNDMWYVFLTVYSNTNRLAANQIEFRSWDASTGLVYTAYPSEEISFESDKVWGTASAPIIFDGEERVVQNIDLIKGWNWISYNVASELFSDPASVLSKAIFAGDEQVKDETNGIYMTYDGVRKQWVNNDPAQALKFDNRHMFLLQSPMVQKLSVSGLAIHEKENLKLDILPNWNYISYLSTVNLPISEALAGFEAVEGDIIKSQDRFSMYGETTGWLGSLTYLEPGKGYMLFSKNKTTLTYPDVTAGTTTRSTISTRSAGMPVETMAEQTGQYAANMSVVATVADNMPLYSGDRLLAYANGELRAEAMVTERPSDGESLFFLSVGGDRNEGISFALERGGEIIAETSPMLDYAANTVRGDIEQPMIIDFINDLEISVYPNPFEHELNFMLNAKSGDKVEIMLYTMAGQMFHRYQTTAAADGYIHHRYHAAADMSKGIYMATVIINGERHVYKISKR